VDIAAIPIDGIDLVARGLWGAIAILVSARRIEGQSALMNLPCKYAQKIAYGPKVQEGPGQVHLDASVRDNLEIIAMKLGKRVQDLAVLVLERPRHEKLIAEIRKAGASARLVSDGDVAAALAPSQPDTGIDVYMGIGGAAEAVLAAAAIRCLGGEMLVRPHPLDEQEKQALAAALGPEALRTQYRAADLARGDGIIFCATGISDGSILRGVHVNGTVASTSSVVMRSRYRTVRKIGATHDLSTKTIRLRTAGAEAKL
jgi:fructose-1,6-bisphosphatase II